MSPFAIGDFEASVHDYLAYTWASRVFGLGLRLVRRARHL
jgi:hypothetical protein